MFCFVFLFLFFFFLNAKKKGYHVDTNGGLLNGMDVSPSGEMLFVGDSHGYLHQWVDREQARLNLFPKTLEQPAPIRPLPTVLPDDESVPLSMFDTGVPGLRARQGLLSNWPENMFFLHPQPMPSIPSVYVQNLQPARDGDFIMYAHVPKNPGLLRYQHPWPEPVRFVDLSLLHPEPVDALAEPFSPVRSNSSSKKDSLLTPIAASSPNPAFGVAQVAKPPGLYQQKTISYTKLGVSGFDFEFYNRTPFSGLENTLANSIFNGALQMLYFLPQIRSALLSHGCKREFCLSCELGLLFKMLDRSAGAVCQASNLLRTLQNIPLARTMQVVGLDDSTFRDKRQGIALIERFVEFVLIQLKAERLENEPDVFGSLLAASKKVLIVCKTCGSERRREEPSSDPVRLVYQDDGVKLSFGALLRQSLRAHIASGTRLLDQDEWCERCGNKQPSRAHPSEAVAASLPPMLMLFSNLGKTAASNCEMWKSAGGRAAVTANSNVVNSVLADDGGEGLLAGGDGPNVSTWLPSSVRVSVDASGTIQVEEISGDSAAPSTSQDLSAVYTVSSLLCHINDPRKMPSPCHSVLHQKIAPSHTQDKSLVKSFFMFNDFHVVRTNAREALNFDGVYKVAYKEKKKIPILIPFPILNFFFFFFFF